MFLAILQGKLANLQSWCELLQQLKWLLSARPLPRLGNTHALLSVRPQKKGFLQLDGNSRTAAQPPKHLSAFSLHSHPSSLLSTFGNTGSLEQEPLGKLRKHKGHETKTVWLNAVLGLPFPGFFSSKTDDVRVVAIFHCLHWEGSVVVSYQKGVGFFGFVFSLTKSQEVCVFALISIPSAGWSQDLSGWTQHTCRPLLETKCQECVAKDFFQNLVGYFAPAVPDPACRTFIV